MTIFDDNNANDDKDNDDNLNVDDYDYNNVNDDRNDDDNDGGTGASSD